MSLSQKYFGSSLLILLHETLKSLFSPTVSVSFLLAYQKGWSQIGPLSFGTLGPDGEGQLHSSPRTLSEGDSNAYPNGAAWEWRARPESSSLGESPRSRHPGSNPQTPGTLPDACGTSPVKSPPSSPIPRTPPSGLLTQALAAFCKPGPGPAPISPRKQHPRALRALLNTQKAESPWPPLPPFGAQPLLIHPPDLFISTLASDFFLLGAPE